MTQETNLIPVDSREKALEVVKLVANNTPTRDLAPYLRSLTTHGDEQTFAIMRGSGNDMPPVEQLVVLLAGAGFINSDEACASLEARDVAKGRRVE